MQTKDEGETMMTMQGRICLITGGTNGIGKSTAQGLARMGATVVIVGRNAQKTAQVVEEIRISKLATNTWTHCWRICRRSRKSAAWPVTSSANIRSYTFCSTTRAEHSRHVSSVWMASK